MKRTISLLLISFAIFFISCQKAKYEADEVVEAPNAYFAWPNKCQEAVFSLKDQSTFAVSLSAPSVVITHVKPPGDDSHDPKAIVEWIPVGGQQGPHAVTLLAGEDTAFQQAGYYRVTVINPVAKSFPYREIMLSANRSKPDSVNYQDSSAAHTR